MKISVLGCGWLGLPLAKRMVEEGYHVKGSTTTRHKMSSLTSEGISPYYIKLYGEGVEGDLNAFLSDADWVIIDIPPGLRSDPETNYVGKIGRLKDYMEKASVPKVIFISSTSVYKNADDIPEYTEKDKANAEDKNGTQLISAENIIKSGSYNPVILRFGGLIGPGRHPVNYLSNRSNISDPEAPVNLIHQHDCIELIKTIIATDFKSGVINGVFPEHPLKKDYYINLAKTRNLAIPEFDLSSTSKGKIISSEVLGNEIDFNFSEGIWD